MTIKDLKQTMEKESEVIVYRYNDAYYNELTKLESINEDTEIIELFVSGNKLNLIL